eukprot:TRINITY_DN2655_c0_g1_i2.p2 TRINITY_DN2655_c0_g1~~TRINITY_DN2655_c0_g1_i2.p2  ORF type:complete len:359 (-),score=84.37 TRINITY_DN2655_c0_g1_i2:78-1154(-)
MAEEVSELLNARRSPLVTECRGFLMLSTIICILAVDFQVFPRRFAKTEFYGHSLMDVGVAAFAFYMGVSAGFKEPSPATASQSWAMYLVRVVFSSLPVLALGVGRAVVLKLLDYPEHVSEYGTHWNFFCTLFFVGIGLAVVVRWRGHNRTAFLLGAAELFVLHATLLRLGLEEYVHDNPPRNNFFQKNIEGLASLPGYLVLALAGAALGDMLRAAAARRTSARGWALNGAFLCGASLALFAIYWAFTRVTRAQPSRVVANAPFLIYNLAVLLLNLAVSLASQLAFPLPPCSLVKGLSDNLLPLFLLANLATGAVNLLLGATHEYSQSAGIIVLGLYLLPLCCVARRLGRRNLCIPSHF